MFFGDSGEKDAVVQWLGSQIKSITTMAERSASGLNKTAGVLVLAIEPQTVIGKSQLQVGDVIISAEGDEIDTVADLMKTYQNNNWKGKLNLTIFRNQKEKQVLLNTKK
jgi:S1-C subfamily serine protease